MMNEENLDVEGLRKDLEKYFERTTKNYRTLAIISLSTVENATAQKLIDMAKRHGFDLEKYKLENQ